MKRTFLMACLVGILFLNVSAQVVEEKPNSDEVYSVVDQMPEFPGGEDELNEFMDKNLQYPKAAKTKGIQGKVWAGFVVDVDGTIKDVEILRGIGGGCDEEVIRVLKLMPKWTPGKQNGKAVMVKYRFPINFTLR